MIIQIWNASRRGLSGVVQLEGYHPRTEHSCPDATPRASSVSFSVSQVEMNTPTSSKATPLKSRILLFILAVTELCTFASISVLSPFFPKEAESKGSTGKTYGAIIGVFELAALVTSIACIKIVLHVSPRKVLLLGIALLGVGIIAFSFVDNLSPGSSFVSTSIIFRVVQGLGAGMIDVCSYMVVSYIFPHKASLSIGVLEMAVGLGITVGPVFGGALYEQGGFMLPFLILGALVLATFPGNYILFPDAERKSTITRKSIFTFMRSRDVLVGVLSITSGGMTLGFLTSILEPRLREYNLSISMVGLITVLPGGVFAVLTPIWGHLTDILENHRYFLLIGADVLTIAGYMFLGPVQFVHLDSTLSLLLGSLFICGLGAAAQSICPFALMLSNTKKLGQLEDLVAAALVSAVHITCSTAGTSLGPIIGGYFLDVIGFRNFCLVMVFFGVFQAVIYVLALIHKSKKLCFSSIATV